MKVIILAGGFGSRLAEYTEVTPKPMVRIGSQPIIWHIMRHYAYFGYNEFILALGYKAEIIKEYFLNYKTLSSDFTIDMESESISYHKQTDFNWKVTLVDTGLNTMTGGRIKRLREFVGNEPFMLTYGDGLSNINLNELVSFHTSKKKILTLSAVRPVAKFGDLKLKDDLVGEFNEKTQLQEGWINGGFFVCEPDLFDFIDGDEQMLEREPISRLVGLGQVSAFRHSGFWHCMDTIKHKEVLEEMWQSGEVPWRNWHRS